MLDTRLHEGKVYLKRFGKPEKILFEAPTGKYTRSQMKHFLDCIQKGAKPFTDGPGSLQSLRVIWRMYEAESRGVEADLRGLGLDQPWNRKGLDKLPANKSRKNR